MSLKAFRETDEAAIARICRGIFVQWHNLLKNRETVSILLWVGDGSEILDYAGNLDDTFEWARFIGTANLPLLAENESKDISLHEKKQNYIDNPPVFTYRILKKIVGCLKQEGKKLFPNTVIKVGETFDIGPEFAVSEFKYQRHTEICTGLKLDHHGMVDATAHLHADERTYAAFPKGIPEGLPFGSFLGEQCRFFLPDMGFDYLWLSNGLGFSAEPWSMTGKIYDGTQFYPQRLTHTSEQVFEFWKLIKDSCPDIQIETRGTNNSVGIDYATDGVPLYDIYRENPDVLPPPNSPWAALNDNYGLELMGHMTRICEIPKKDYMFRYYIHDPWWCNSPWYDRYRENASDIYLPMSISRIDEAGAVQPASICSILSIDNSFGNMPDSCVNETIPHLLKAEKDSPDDIADFVWIYPMREYTRAFDEDTLREMYFGDKFISNAINDGFPLCCVVSSDNFIQHELSLYQNRILISPFPTGELRQKLLNFCESGGKVIIYTDADRKKALTDNTPFTIVNISDSPACMRAAIMECGYSINFEKKSETIKNPCISISKSNGARIFSIYNRNLTTDIFLKYPLGAPVFINYDVELCDGYAKYRLNRCSHCECRSYIKQNSGIVSAYEVPPVSGKYRRRIELSGLEDATVYFIPETYCINSCMIAYGKPTSDSTPVYDAAFELVKEDGQWCYKAEHISGARAFLMPFQKSAFSY